MMKEKPTMKKLVSGIVFVPILLVMAAVPLRAQTNFWIAPGGGILNDAANWSLGAPAVGQTLSFTNAASYAVTNSVDTDLQLSTLFNASGGTVTYVGNDTLAVGKQDAVPNRGIFIGTVPGAMATVDFVKGNIDAHFGYITVGRDGGRGHMRMRDKMGTIHTIYQMSVGDNSSGNTLEIRDGAFLDKAGATHLFVGNKGSENSLLISSGGALTNGARLYIGYDSGAKSNRVVVADSGSSLSLKGSTSNLVGYNGSVYNELIVTNGGHVTVSAGTSGLVIGQYASYNRTVVTGSNSLLSCAGRIALSPKSSDSYYTGNCLDIIDGGQATMATLEFTGAIGSRVTVTGAGSRLRAGVAQVGMGTGTTIMEVSDGALAEAEKFTLGLGTGLNNQVLADQAGLVATNAAGGGIFEILRGTVSLANGSTLIADSLCITNTAAPDSRITATIGSIPAGVVLTGNAPAAMNLAVPGGVKLVFTADPADELKPLWGLKVPGDQVAILSGLVADGKITYDTSDLPRASQKRFGVHYDVKSDTSFIGLSKKVVGTQLVLR